MTATGQPQQCSASWEREPPMPVALQPGQGTSGVSPHGWQGWSLTHILLMSLSSFLYRIESFRTWRNDGDNQ